MDGTLTDPKVGITTCARYGLAKVGCHLTEQDDLDWIIGPPLKASLAKILGVSVEDERAEQALLGYRERFSTVGLFENEVYPRVDSTLGVLASQYRLFVATAKPTIYAKRILEHFNLAQYFTRIYGSELNGDRTNKGELIAYILGSEQLNPEETLMVGDREFDILGARHNGVNAVVVTYGYGTTDELERAQAHYTISSFDELLTVLQ